jgi:hypothetical protein
MDDLTPPDEGDVGVGDAAGSNSVRLVPLPPQSLPAFALGHPYLEVVYTPLLGPTAVLLARTLGRHLAIAQGPVTVSTVDTALQLGLRARHVNSLGHRSPFQQAIDRLVHVRFVRWHSAEELGVHTSVPPVSGRALDKLPAAVREAHDRLLAAALEGGGHGSIG